MTSATGGADRDRQAGDGDVPEAGRSLPSGLVTFVMTDIEGSTRLFHEQGAAYPALLETHQRLLRRAFGAHDGVEIETEGDALIVAFGDAAEAVAGCLEGQLALAGHDWPPGGEVRVRFGVHTGEAEPVGRHYVSIALHQVARICAGAHGGQILMSEATAIAAADRLPAGAELEGLGSFQLRGFPSPERLFQVRHPDLRAAFPPLRALGIVEHNLPFLRTSFVGRVDDRAAVAELLRTTGVVTVVGLGGVGKTRLAVQVAFDVMEDFADGAWLVELAALTEPGAVPRAVAAAVRVPEEPGRTIDEVVVEALGPKSVLLVLDNCEHLLDPVARFAERLTLACPHLVILATSREPLDIEGEAVWRVDPLPTADPDEVTGAGDRASEAVRLFAERAALVRPGFRITADNAVDAARLVAQLNGIPLAIELAAAALAERPLSGVLDGLADRFSLLTHGRRTAAERHQTLRAALEWSLDLLPGDQRRLFARLAAFAGGGPVDAAADVCGGPPVVAAEIPSMLSRLVRASLLVSQPDLPERWTMLESIRRLAEIELAAAGETDAMAARHRAWYLRRVEEVGDAIGLRGRADVMTGLAADHDNVRRAVDSAIAAGDADTAMRLGVAMAPFWTSHGDWTEGSERLDGALSVPGGDPQVRGRARAALGNLALLRGDIDEAGEHFEQARELAVAADDDVALARALSGAGYIAFRHSRLAEAERMWEQALARAERAGDERVAAGILRSLAIAAGSSGEQARAGELLDRAIAAAQRAEDDQLLRLLLGSAAEMHLWLGHYQVAADAYGDALDLASTIGDLSARPLLLAELGWVSLLRGDVGTAHRLSVEAADLAEDLGNRRVFAHALRLTGEALARRGGAAEASTTLEMALTVARGLGAPAEEAGVLCSQACLALDEQLIEDARTLAEAAIELSSLAHSMRRTSPAWVLGVVALEAGDVVQAESHFAEDLAEAARFEIPRHEANSLWGLAGVAAAGGDHRAAAELHRRALEIRHRIGDRLGTVDSLVGVAGVAAATDPEASARLLTAATVLRTRAGAVPTTREAAGIAAAAESVNAADPAMVVGDPDEDVEVDFDAVVESAMRLTTRVDDDGTGVATRHRGPGQPG